MAKSEHTSATAADTNDTEGYDVEATLKEDLSELGEEIEISGRWELQFRGGKPVTGVSDSGPWRMLNLFFQPITPAGDHDLTEQDLDDLPAVRHRMFYTGKQDKKAFVALANLMDVEAAPLEDMLKEMRGESVSAIVTLGKDNRGAPEYKITGFKRVEEDLAEAA